MEKLFDVKVKRDQHAEPQGQGQGTSAAVPGIQSDVKRAIVTLEEGHWIDVTTGPVRADIVWH